MFAKRITNLQDSLTRTLDTKAKSLQKKGYSIINLAAGEADFPTPKQIQRSAIQAITDGFTRYTAAQGIIELRAALAEKFRKENNLEYDPSQIVVGAGGKQLLYTAFHVLCDKGDEVLIPIPAWPSFIEQVKLSGATPVFVTLKPPFRLTAADIKKALTAKTKVILLNSPSNPSGMIIEKKELEKIAALAIKHNVWVISDEIYEKLLFEGEHVSIASLNKAIKGKTITINGFSKSYAMTGWRLGYAAGPKEVIAKMIILQNHIISSASSISQKAGVAALTEEQKTIAIMQKAFKKRRDFLAKALATIPDFSFTKPDGSFYFFISVKKLLGKKYPTSFAWCEALLEKENVALVPGEAFSYPGYVRLSFSVSMEDLQEAVKRIQHFLSVSS